MVWVFTDVKCIRAQVIYSRGCSFNSGSSCDGAREIVMWNCSSNSSKRIRLRSSFDLRCNICVLNYLLCLCELYNE
jgi:hypothetical protein